MADNIRKPARARMWKRVAIITASVSTFVVAAFVVISFLPFGNEAFSIRIDDTTREQAEENRFHMSRGWIADEAKDEGDAGTRIRGEAVDSMVATKSESVENYLAELNAQNLLNGQTNFYKMVKDDKGDYVQDKGLALVYTIYLVNEDTSKDLHLKYSVNADSYYNTNTVSILDYFRVLAQTEVMGSNEVVNTYYGRKHTFDDRVNALGNYREAISTTVTYRDHWEEYPITADFKSSGNDGYCIDFLELSDTNNKIVYCDDLVVPAGKTLRFTYASYFEGDDPDCHGSNPSSSYLQLSLHFGV